VFQIILEYVVLNTQVVASKRRPSFIAFRHTCDDDGNDTSYIRGEPTLAGFVPGSQIMPDINGIESSTPVHVDQRVKHVCRPCPTGGIEASGEPSDFDGFGD